MSNIIMTPWLIVFSTTIIIYLLDRWENRVVKSLFDWFPSILLAYVIPATISILCDLDLSSHHIHDYSKSFFIPLAIISVMSSLSLLQLKSIGWKPILLFVIGSSWISLFPAATVLILRNTHFVQNTLISQELWMGIPPLVGSWIGGSTSQLVLKEILGCPEDIFLTILVLDNILVNVWTILMFQMIKRSESINTLLSIHSSDRPQELELKESFSMRSSIWLCIPLLLAGVFSANLVLDSFLLKVIILSVMGLAISNFVPNWNHAFSLKLGGILILVIMSILGLKLRFDTFTIMPSFIFFLIVWLIGHLAIMTIFARLLSIHSAWIPIASMANVGGIATAPAVTAAYNKEWMPHAVILAILSMATGTFWGLLTIYLLRSIV